MQTLNLQKAAKAQEEEDNRMLKEQEAELLVSTVLVCNYASELILNEGASTVYVLWSDSSTERAGGSTCH